MYNVCGGHFYLRLMEKHSEWQSHAVPWDHGFHQTGLSMSWSSKRKWASPSIRITYCSSDFISLLFHNICQKMSLQATSNVNYVQLNWNVEFIVKIYKEVKI